MWTATLVATKYLTGVGRAKNDESEMRRRMDTIPDIFQQDGQEASMDFSTGGHQRNSRISICNDQHGSADFLHLALFWHLAVTGVALDRSVEVPCTTLTTHHSCNFVQQFSNIAA